MQRACPSVRLSGCPSVCRQKNKNAIFSKTKIVTEERHMVHDNLAIACHGSGRTDVYRTSMR